MNLQISHDKWKYTILTLNSKQKINSSFLCNWFSLAQYRCQSQCYCHLNTQNHLVTFFLSISSVFVCFDMRVECFWSFIATRSVSCVISTFFWLPMALHAGKASKVWIYLISFINVSQIFFKLIKNRIYQICSKINHQLKYVVKKESNKKYVFHVDIITIAGPSD